MAGAGGDGGNRRRGRRGALFGGDTGVGDFGLRQGMHRFPRRNAQREIEQLDRGAHLGGVLRELADVALHQHEVLGRVGRRGRILAAVAQPDLVHHHARLRRHHAVHARDQHEGAHGFAIGARRKLRARQAMAGIVEIDGAADGGVEAELADGAAERDGAVHRAAVAIEHDAGAGQIAIAREQFEVARRVRGDGAVGRDEEPALAAAGLRRTFLAQFETHRQRAVGAARDGRQKDHRRRERKR